SPWVHTPPPPQGTAAPQTAPSVVPPSQQDSRFTPHGGTAGQNSGKCWTSLSFFFSVGSSSGLSTQVVTSLDSPSRMHLKSDFQALSATIRASLFILSTHCW